MSFISLTNQEHCLNHLESLLRLPQRTWKNTWSFNLHGKLPFNSVCSVYDDDPSVRKKLKTGIRKYYGKKIRYVSQGKDLNFFVSHCKLVRSAEIQETFLHKNNLKTKGDLVIFGINVRIQEKHKLLCFKKILKHCQKADIRTRNGLSFWLFDEMLALSSLYLEISPTSLMHSLGTIFRNLVNLEQITVKYMITENAGKSNSSGFFSQFQKLPRLKKLRFICNYKVLENMRQELEKFYEKTFNFDFSIKMYFGGVSIGKNGDSLLETILSSAEYLCVEYWEDVRQLFDEISVDLAHEAKKRNGKRNLVELSIENWKKDSKTLLSIFSKINKKCHISLYLRAVSLTDQFRLDGKSSFSENFSLALEEIRGFEKINVFKLLITVDNVNPVILGKILSNKTLEIFQLNLYAQKERNLRNKWDKCFMLATKSQVKELNVKISKGVKTPLFERNLLDYIRSLDNLQVVELADENLGTIAFDFLNGLVKSLLEKKEMRRILICTRVKGSSENFGNFFSKIFGTQPKWEKTTLDWEKRVEELKSLQLEEILIGKLSDERFNYLLFNRKMGVTEKLFWTQAEMEDLLISHKELKNLYLRIFYLLLENEALFEMS